MLLYCWPASCQLCWEQKAERLLTDPAVLKEALTSPPFLMMALSWLDSLPPSSLKTLLIAR